MAGQSKLNRKGTPFALSDYLTLSLNRSAPGRIITALYLSHRKGIKALATLFFGSDKNVIFNACQNNFV
jgi:hypothetical protein